MSKHTNFCCNEMFEVFEDGCIDFNPDHVGDTRNIVIIGQYKEGDPEINDSKGSDVFEIKFCPFCGIKL